jgi:hypothetical protein
MPAVHGEQQAYKNILTSHGRILSPFTQHKALLANNAVRALKMPVNLLS